MTRVSKAAHAAAAGRAELTNNVIAEARQLLAVGKIDASDEFAEALGSSPGAGAGGVRELMPKRTRFDALKRRCLMIGLVVV